MSKHTPGPWKVVGTEIWGTNHRVAYGKGAYDDKDREHNKANARLIAAAPELHALAEHVVAMANDDYLNGHPE
jgi:hypothetical protein